MSPKEVVERDGITVVETDRGGDVTFHGPGQLVGYPILRLGSSSLGSDVVGYVHALEERLIVALRALGVADAHAKPERDADGNHLTGVWCGAPAAKVCAIGVGIAGGVTRHGFALNIDIALERYTRHVVPCGLSGRGVTSLARVLPATPDRAEVVDAVTAALTDLFGRHVAAPRATAGAGPTP